MSEALVLFSGGQDSTTCLYWAKGEFQKVRALGYRYGQRHEIEIKQAHVIAHMANVPFDVLDLTGLLANSALLDVQRSTDAPHPSDAALPASFVPGRNLLFLSVAGAFAYARGITDLVTGVCQTDFAGYPDCRRVFVDSMEQTLSLAMAPARFHIHTPLMDLDKAETFKLAADLDVLDIILEHTHTDYHGDRTERHPWGYGKLDNEASRLRARGWDEFCRRYPELVTRK